MEYSIALGTFIERGQTGKACDSIASAVDGLFGQEHVDGACQGVDYIFCINTGRSGSLYLKKLFDHVSGCRAFHEPEPTGEGPAMLRYLNGDPEPMSKLVQQKIRNIKTIKRDCRLYVETNNLFIKGFGWFIPEYLPEDKIGVIVLGRERSKIVESFLSLGWSPLHENVRDWIITPEIKHPLVAPPKRFLSPKATYFLFRLLKMRCKKENFYRKVFYSLKKFFRLRPLGWILNYESECLNWYVEEMAARAKAFQERFKRIKYYSVNIEDLNTVEAVDKMFKYFGCRAEKSLTNIVGIPAKKC